MINFLTERVNDVKAWIVSVTGAATGTLAGESAEVVDTITKSSSMEVFQYCSYTVAILSGILAGVVSVLKIIEKRKAKK